jgi:hypothetical protein
VISRRVNLFEKVLIPRSKNIRKIRMALADAERDAVVRAKISKRKTAARAAAKGGGRAMSIVPLSQGQPHRRSGGQGPVLEAVQAFGALPSHSAFAAQKDLEAVPAGTGREASEALRWLVDAPAQRRPVTSPEGFDLEDVSPRRPIAIAGP